MGKHKKKHSKKDTISDDLLDAAALSIRNYRKVTNEIAKLSTGQKLVGGLVLLAAGYFYLDKVKQDAGKDSLLASLNLPLPWLPKAKEASGPPPKPTLPAAPAPAEAPRKSRKSAKAGKTAGAFGKKPAASPDDL